MHQRTLLGLRHGAIFGFASVIAMLFLYFLFPQYFFNFFISIIVFLLMFVFMFNATRTARVSQGGYGTFRELISPAFAFFAIATLISTVFNYILYNLIDPDLSDSLKNYVLESTQQMMQGWNVPSEKIDAELDRIQEQDFSLSLVSLSRGLAYNLIFGFMVSAIIAAVSQKKRPFSDSDSAV